jgi:hypothetical protein
LSQAEPHIDFARIAFPSDRLSIGAIRRAFPKTLDGPQPRGAGRSLDNILSGLIDVERQLAEDAFSAAVGRRRRWAGARHRGNAVAELSSEYVLFGLAEGPHHARELIRGVEAQAIAQANAHLGKPV